MSAKRVLLLIVLIPVLVVVLSVGGYIIFNELLGQHQENLEELHKFGFNVMPVSKYVESTGVLGANQQPSTFSEEKLTPTQKVIRGLMRDNEQLIEDKQALKDEIESLRQTVAKLEEYKRLNEHFAPLSMSQQMAAVEQQMLDMLKESKDASRFRDSEKVAMAAAVAREYRTLVRRRQLVLNEAQRQELVEQQLASFAFCVGDGIQVAANTKEETLLLAAHFRPSENSEPLPAQLQNDLDTVLKPCLNSLHTQLAQYQPSP